jgi:hypothetical protein
MPDPLTRKARARLPGLPACCLALGAADMMSAALPARAQEFTVDEEAAAQAIERAMVQTGSILLPPRTVEVVPFFSYQRDENEVAGLPVLVNGQIVGSSIALESNEFNGGVTVRGGLPWNGQLQLTVPFTYAQRDQEQRVLGATAVTSSSDLSGLGDVQVSYTQQIRGNMGGLPSLLGSVTWDSDTGETDEADGLFLGSGFQELGVSLTATQRQDPLVFSARVGYQWAFENDDVKPGDQLSFGAGAFLAVNPETSVQFGLSMAYTDDAEINGQTLEGSDQLAASLNLGIATILRRNTLLDATVNVGLTEDAPDFAFALDLPIRFTF